jgi:hypothetical protein
MHNKNKKVIKKIAKIQFMGLFNGDTSFAMGQYNYTQYLSIVKSLSVIKFSR